MMTRSFILAAVVMMSAGVAQAETIVSWATFGQPGNQDFTPVLNEAAGVTGTNMTRGAGLTPNPGNNSFNSAGWTGEDTDYIEFGFSVDAGLFASLDSLFLGSRSSNTGPGTIGVFTSLDGFSSSIFEIQQSGTNFTNSIIDLSSLGPITGDFSLRLIQIGTTAANGGTTLAGGSFRIGDYFDGSTFTTLQITGEIRAIPEPSSVVLMGLGIAGLASMARLRQQNS
ncbi:PEP-CTERM sorting domain-containing protein [Tautonia rosea]|uniref:PEP-CTERM sorting domain-containing protein n=1 Tax=Tautonia rosea TaxID=2728037 RepID=UPI00147509A8|nr:PEP-CTERM sorting domain-containing protein [Tautonia rosea]